jgi:hypothetical protein
MALLFGRSFHKIIPFFNLIPTSLSQFSPEFKKDNPNLA